MYILGHNFLHFLFFSNCLLCVSPLGSSDLATEGPFAGWSLLPAASSQRPSGTSKSCIAKTHKLCRMSLLRTFDFSCLGRLGCFRFSVAVLCHSKYRPRAAPHSISSSAPPVDKSPFLLCVAGNRSLVEFHLS